MGGPFELQMHKPTCVINEEIVLGISVQSESSSGLK